MNQMTDSCFFCGGGPERHNPKPSSKPDLSCPRNNRKVLAAWEEGYNDALKKKPVRKPDNGAYTNGYSRGWLELREIRSTKL